MDFRLLLTLLDYKRIFIYLSSIVYASKVGVLSLKKDIRGMLSLPEGVTLHKLATSLPQASTIVEIGCYGGLSTAFLLSGAQNKTFLYSIDPFDINIEKQKKIVNQYFGSQYKKTEISLISKKPSRQEVEKSLRQKGLNNFTLITGYSHKVIGSWTKQINLLWIDGNHDYKAVKQDFLQWSPFLKKGGIIALHDANKKGRSAYWTWGWEGPSKIVNELMIEPYWIHLKRVDSLVYATKNFH